MTIEADLRRLHRRCARHPGGHHTLTARPSLFRHPLRGRGGGEGVDVAARRHARDELLDPATSRRSRPCCSPTRRLWPRGNTGVVRYLEEGPWLPIGAGVVPIVPTAVLMQFGVVFSIRPDARGEYAATLRNERAVTPT